MWNYWETLCILIFPQKKYLLIFNQKGKQGLRIILNVQPGYLKIKIQMEVKK
jgi:hypothetical protein